MIVANVEARDVALATAVEDVKDVFVQRQADGLRSARGHLLDEPQPSGPRGEYRDVIARSIHGIQSSSVAAQRKCALIAETCAGAQPVRRHVRREREIAAALPAEYQYLIATGSVRFGVHRMRSLMRKAPVPVV